MNELKSEKLFNELYYSDNNILNNNDLWKQIKKDERFDNKLTRKDFDNWLKKQEQEQIKTIKYKPVKTMTHPIIAKPNSYQVDLMFLKELYSLNNGHDAIINFIEVTNKKAFSYPLKSKTKSEVLDAFNMFYKEIDGKIEFLEIDKGTEFSDVIKFCKSNNITVIVYNNDKNSMSIVERFNRTLRGYIDKKMKNGVWINKLNIIVNAYNNKIHSSTGYSPNDLYKNPKLQDDYRDEQFSKAIIPRMELNKFHIGDKIRVYKKKTLFGKGLGEYSKSIHTITDIRRNSIYLDNKDEKYRYYNVLKVDGQVENNNDDNDDIPITMAKQNYKTALKLAKEQTNRINVKELDQKLQNNLIDDTMGRGKRIKKQTSLFTN